METVSDLKNKTMKTAIILGSARKDGNTAKLVDKLSTLTHFDMFDVFDLADYQISYYDYQHNNRDDDFFPLIKNLIDNYDTLIFATPVYWYSMSAIMKVFVDRTSDLLTIEKEYGRKLKGKNMAVITSSMGDNLGDDFWLPFQKTAEYFEMNYITGLHTLVDEVNVVELEGFVSELSVSAC